MARVPCAGAIVQDCDGRLLLVLRRNPPAAGSWSLPGGRVEPGETAAAAVAREVLEETGLEVAVGEPLLVAAIGDYDVEDFAATVTGGTLRAGDDAADARWFGGDELARVALSPGLLDALGGLDLLG